MNWTPLTAPRPPAAANGHATMAYDPERGVLLAHPEDALQVWRWAGDGWALLAKGLASEHVSATPQMVHAYGQCWVFLAREGEMELITLDGESRRLKAEGVTPWAHHGCSGFDGERVLVHVNEGNGGLTFAFDGEALTLLGEGPYLLSGDVDPRRGQLVGVDVFNRVLAFDGAAWAEVGKAPRFTSSDMCWDPRRKALVRLVADGDKQMLLHEEKDGVWRPTQVKMTPLMASAALCVDPRREQMISFGGQDFRAAGDWSDGTWVAKTGALKELAAKMALTLGRHTTPGPLGEELAAVNHSSLGVDVLRDGVWQSVLPEWPQSKRPDSGSLYDLSVNFGLGGGRGVMLDGDGGLWEWTPGAKAWSRLAPGGAGPKGRYARRVGVCCDADRVVVFGGWSQNDTWVFEGGAWRELDSVGGPRPGITELALTPKGFYLLNGHDLWRLEGERWVCVASDAKWFGRALRYEPKRGLLLAVATGESWEQKLVAYSGGGWKELGPMPESPTLVHAGSGEAELGLDPQGDRLVLLSKRELLALDLSELELPAGELPTAPVKAAAAAEPAPPEHRRPAAAILPAEGPEVSAADLGVKVPTGWRLLAVLPGHPKLEALGDWPGAAVLTASWELCDKEGWQPWMLGGGGVELRRLERAPERPHTRAGYDSDRLRPCRYQLIEEVDPEVEEEYATPKGNQREMALGSKLGGFGRFIQGEPRAPKGAVFALQLSGDLFEGEFGDAGSLYAYRDGEQGLVEIQSC